MKRVLGCAIVLTLFCGACSPVPQEAAKPVAQISGPANVTAREPLRIADVQPLAGNREIGQLLNAESMVELSHAELRESSGLALSPKNADMIWTHNDSGDKPRLFAFSTTGQFLATYMVDGAVADDWEDMAAFAWDGDPYLLVGDIGGNVNRKHPVQLFLVREPDLAARENLGNNRQIHAARRFRVDFDGQGVETLDVESLAVDPTDRSILLVEKKIPVQDKQNVIDALQQLDEAVRARVFRIRWPEMMPSDDFALEEVTASEIGTIPILLVTGMDISADGRRLLMTNYVGVYEWSRNSLDESWQEALKRPAKHIKTLVGGYQYEAICYDRGGQAFWLTRELRGADLNRPGAPALTPLFRLKLQ